MSYRSIVALALCLGAGLCVGGEPVYAQRVSNNAYRKPLPRATVPARGRMSRASYAEEELPAVREQSRMAPALPVPPGGMPSNPFNDDSGQMVAQGPTEGCCDDYCGDNYGCDVPCDTGCCSTCEPCSSSRCFITADYLFLRSSFSDSVEFVEIDSQGTVVDQSVTQFEFDYESSFRVGGGYRMSDCGDEIRFMYTRMESSAFDQQDAGNDITVPYLVSAPVGGEYRFHGDAEINSYELEYSKTFPLGGSNCGCGDACGCGDGCCDGCGSSCPAWDMRWSGGFRAADAEWHRIYAALGTSDEFLENAVSSMDFDGAGLKAGLEGRRYFCQSGWLSIYAKGDLSLLYGNLEFNTVMTTEGGSVPDAVVQQSTTSNQLIPVTELEAGVTGQISCHARISAGYLLSAWHDLGFRDEFPLSTADPDPNDPNNQGVELPIEYDDANILGFDGFFARLEFAY